MEFLSAFKEPTVIISITFSFLLFLFPNQGRRIGEWLLNHLGDASQRLKGYIRVKAFGNKRVVVQTIRNPHEMQWQITRTYSLMLLFGVSITTYAILVAIGPLKDIGKLPVSIQYFIYSPVLVFEVLWLKQREYTRNLITTSYKRVTRRSTERGFATRG